MEKKILSNNLQHCLDSNLLCTRHDAVYVITLTNSIDDDDSDYSKLQKRNNTTKLVKDFLVGTNIDKYLWYISNNKLCVFASFDKSCFKRNQIKNETLSNKMCLLEGVFKREHQQHKCKRILCSSLKKLTPKLESLLSQLKNNFALDTFKHSR